MDTKNSKKSIVNCSVVTRRAYRQKNEKGKTRDCLMEDKKKRFLESPNWIS